MRKSRIIAVVAVVACLGVFAGSAFAQDKEPVIPLTLQDMSGKSNVAIGLPMVPHDKFFGLAPILSGQFGLGNMAFGLTVPLAIQFPDEGDTGFALGNVTLDGKFHMCTDGNWAICYGGGLALGAGFLEADEGEVVLAHVAGAVAQQDYSYHFFEALTLRPLAFVAVTDGALFFQVEFGATIGIPIINTDNKDSMEAAIMYGFAAGYKIADIVAPMLEFKGFSPVTEDNVDSYFWLNFGARFYLGSILPYVRLAVPLSDEAKIALAGDAPIQFDVGCMFQF